MKRSYESPRVLDASAWMQEYVDERIAIRIHDGGQTEAEARKGALDDLAWHVEHAK